MEEVHQNGRAKNGGGSWNPANAKKKKHCGTPQEDLPSKQTLTIYCSFGGRQEGKTDLGKDDPGQNWGGGVSRGEASSNHNRH